MKTHKFARKPFYVDAVRVSEANIEEVAAWCEGEIDNTDDGQAYIKVKVHRPLTERQTQAFIGDWVLYAGTGFKVYVPKAFDKSFEKVKTLTKAQADEAGIKVPHEKSQRPARAVPTAPKKKVDVQTEAGDGVKSFDQALEETQSENREALDKLGSEGDIDYRSSETGQFVTEEFAEKNPSTTVAETESVLEQQLPAAKKAKTAEDVEADKLIAEVLKGGPK